MSTFCRSCGEHFRIKDGEAVTPKGLHVSGIATFRDLGEVEVVEDSPIARHNKAIEAQPSPKKEKFEPEKPANEEVSARPETLTSASQTGAETWLESAKKAEKEKSGVESNIAAEAKPAVKAEPVEEKKSVVFVNCQ